MQMLLDMPSFQLLLKNNQLPCCTKKSALIISCSLFMMLLSSCKFRQKADMIVHHAKIYTVDDAFSLAEAMAIRDGRSFAIGILNDDILKEYEVG